MTKSPLRYPGGKSRAVSLISSLIPPFQEFREPFLGGGSVLLAIKQQFPNRIYWGNDIYEELYLFWTYAQQHLPDLFHQIQAWKNTFAEGKQLHRYLVENIDSFSDLQKASAFFVFNRITFSGTTQSGGYSEQAYQGRFTASSIERLTPFCKTIQNMNITCLDYQQVVEAEGKDVFIFLDPPYYVATKSALYGKNGKLHTGFDHFRLAETMKRCPHKWLMTLDDSPFIRDLYDFAHISEWNLMYGMRNITPQSNQQGKEVFISNYLEALPLSAQHTDVQLALFEKKMVYLT